MREILTAYDARHAGRAARRRIRPATASAGRQGEKMADTIHIGKGRERERMRIEEGQRKGERGNEAAAPHLISATYRVN